MDNQQEKTNCTCFILNFILHLQQKADKNKVGGKAIHFNSMRILHKQNILTASNSDAENENLNRNPKPYVLKCYKAFRPVASGSLNDFSAIKIDKLEEKIVDSKLHR
jgi:hypothetical protein